MSSRRLARVSFQPINVSLQPLAVLDRYLRDVELTTEQLADAEQSYRAVTDVLAKAGMPVQPFFPFMFAQGSMRLGTTVRPIGQAEHDLDVVCLLRRGGVWLPASEVYQLVWDTLGSDGTYEKMRQRKNRCIRLKYARRFYLDIIPAVPDRASQEGPLFVSDRELRIWCSSHPVGFADWFAGRAELQPIFITKFGALGERQIIANAAQIEPLPEHGFEKTPLQRITQLLKRDRDEHFQSDLKRRPTSILLTTLTAKSYVKQTSIAAPDLLEFIIRVVERLHDFIEIRDTTIGVRTYRVTNPVNESENFAETWTRADYDAFVRWQGTLVRKLRAVSGTKQRGLDVMLNSLGEGFGSERIVAAANALGADTSRVHQAGRLRVAGASGFVGLAGSAMGATVYHGR